LNRSFFLNILFLFTINALIKPLYLFGIERGVQNAVGAEAFGLYFALFNFTFIFYIVNDAGIQYYNTRNIAQHGHLLEKYLPHILLLKGILAVVYLFFTLISAYFIGYNATHWQLLLALVSIQILTASLIYLRSNISGLHLYKTDSVISIIDKSLMIVIGGFFLWINPYKSTFKIEWFIAMQVFSLAVANLVAFLIIRSKITRLVFRWKPVIFNMILKESLPYALMFFLMATYSRLDGVLLERLLPDGQREAGVYASAFRLIDAFNTIGYLFAGLLMPMFAKQIKENAKIDELVRFSFQLIWVGAWAIAVPSIIFRSEIMQLLYHEATPYWGDVLGVLMLSFTAMCGNYVFGTLLTASGNPKRMNKILFSGVIINLILNLILIPTHKALGAGIANMLTMVLMTSLQVVLSHQIFAFRTDFKLILQFFGFITTLSAITLVMYFFGSTMDWRVWFLASGGAAVGLAFLFGLIEMDVLRDKF
jgi:O-antigen/teichoic acid export membrane protein